ncbi:sensor histidine kinase [Nocardioides sp.]|uniref:sensor histidine kinase n=1 Tax=Nocardioides sp. TaxID=35761 RepID=UPI003511B5A0
MGEFNGGRHATRSGGVGSSGLPLGGIPGTADVRQVLFEVAQLLFAGAAPSAVLERIVTTLCAHVGYERCLITSVTAGAGGQMLGQVGFGIKHEDVLQVAELLAEVPVLHSLMCTPGPHVLRQTDLEAAIPSRYVDLFGVAGTLVLIPLIDGQLGPLGLMFLDRDGLDFEPQPQELDVLAEFGEIATLAVQNATLLQDRASLVAMVERSRLASDLHDGVTQRMFTLSLTLKELKELPGLPAAADDLLDRARRDVDAAGSQLRRALTQLVEPEVRTVDSDQAPRFEELLRRTVEEANAEMGLAADFEIAGRGGPPTAARQRVMRRAVREALVNIAKHAGATQVSVILRRSDHHWVVEVHDDGQGRAHLIRRGITSEQSSFGLRSLQSDVDSVGGRIWISQSERLGGLQLTLSVEVME